MSANSAVVEVGWQHDETDFRIRCRYTPGTPDRGPDMKCAGGYPGDPPDLDVLSVREDRTGGRERPDLVEVAEQDLDRIQDAAAEEYSDREDALYDTREESDEARGRP